MLYLSRELYVGFIKLQADKGLGRSYAGLLPFTEGLYRLGYLDQNAYLSHVKKYSEKLVRDTDSKHLSKEQLNEQKVLEEKSRLFTMLLDQWDQHLSPAWRISWIKEAQKYQDKIPNAKLVLELACEQAKKSAAP